MLQRGGTVVLQATQAGNTNWAVAPPVNQSFNVTPQSQSITFGGLIDKVYGSAPFTVSASASSGLAVSFSASPSGVSLSIAGPQGRDESSSNSPVQARTLLSATANRLL